MKNPLSKMQVARFMRQLNLEIEANYEKALKSGALDPSEHPKGDHTILKAVVVLTARGYRPLGSPQLLKNLEHFV